MSDLEVTIQTPHGDVTLPYLQVMSMGRCLEELESQGKQVTWHRGECGCCVVVHEAGLDHVHAGFVIGSDGGYDWVDMEKSESMEGEPE